jgi:hypothetical protein
VWIHGSSALEPTACMLHTRISQGAHWLVRPGALLAIDMSLQRMCRHFDEPPGWWLQIQHEVLHGSAAGGGHSSSGTRMCNAEADINAHVNG